MNIELLEQIKEQITKEPGKFNMESFVCDSSFCIGGWAVFLDSKNKDIPFRMPSFCGQTWEEAAAKALDISFDTLEQWSEGAFSDADRLFYTTNWPQPFRGIHHELIIGSETRYDLSSKLAENACKRIDHFIATGE